MRISWLVLLAMLVACGDDSSSVDAGDVDAGTDGGADVDGGPGVDSGPDIDGGSDMDAGPDMDGGSDMDSGSDDVFHCEYPEGNSFFGLCQEFLGSEVDVEREQMGCEGPGGEWASGTCDQSGTIATCTVDADGPMHQVNYYTADYPTELLTSAETTCMMRSGVWTEL